MSQELPITVIDSTVRKKQEQKLDNALVGLMSYKKIDYPTKTFHRILAKKNSCCNLDYGLMCIDCFKALITKNKHITTCNALYRAMVLEKLYNLPYILPELWDLSISYCRIDNAFNSSYNGFVVYDHPLLGVRSPLPHNTHGINFYQIYCTDILCRYGMLESINQPTQHSQNMQDKSLFNQMYYDTKNCTIN